MLIHGAAWYLAFLFSTTAHEASHAWAALKLGDKTAFHGGQVSLDPIPHIRREPFGMVLIPILAFMFGGWMIGWASTPYDPNWARQYPRRSAWMAAAGPAANLVLVLVAAAIIHIGLLAGVFHVADMLTPIHLFEAGSGAGAEAIVLLVSVFFSLNVLLFTFNLLPVPPMDGSSVLTLILPESVAEKYRELARSPAFTLVGFIVAWKLFGLAYPAIRDLSIRLLFPGIYDWH